MKPSEVILKIKRDIEKDVAAYASSSEFELVASNALIDFIKRVKRGFLPSLSKINPLESEAYIKLRERNRSKLGDKGKPKTSNATATGQMLNAMVYKMKPRGFTLFVDGTARTAELSGASPKLNNAEVAKYYSEKRAIFDFSEPELKRIIRNVKEDLLKIIRRSK